MANPYRELFTAPGTKSLALAGLLARLPLSMTGIGIITMLSQLRGSFALAGAVSATFVLAYALLSPQISRLMDRHGQSRVLPAADGHQRHRDTASTRQFLVAGTRLDFVRRCLTGRFYAQHVGGSAGTLDSYLPGPTALADGLFA